MAIVNGNIVVQIITNHYPGYGAPEEWSLRVIYKNKLLQFIEHITSEQNLGAKKYELSLKWNRDWDEIELDQLASNAPLASSLCDLCGNDTLSGRLYCCNKIICKVCKESGGVAKVEEEYKQQEKQLAAELYERDKRIKEECAATNAELLKGAFHWRDGRYFKRRDDGTVLMLKVHGDYIAVETIPSNEWASIIASVRKGEYDYNEATKFHG